MLLELVLNDISFTVTYNGPVQSWTFAPGQVCSTWTKFANCSITLKENQRRAGESLGFYSNKSKALIPVSLSL